MQKAIIDSIEGTQVRIRIPELHKVNGAVSATPQSELPVAPVCTLPGCNPNLRPGDIVLVDFENEEFGTPIIIGVLFTNKTYNDGIADLTLGSLKVKVNAELPPDTKIGGVTAKNLLNLQNLSEDLQLALDKYRLSIDNNNDRVDDLEIDVEDVKESLIKLQQTIESINSEIENLDKSIKINKDNIDANTSNINKLNATVSNITNPLILQKVCYGTGSPDSVTNPKEGQIYLYIQ